MLQGFSSNIFNLKIFRVHRDRTFRMVLAVTLLLCLSGKVSSQQNGMQVRHQAFIEYLSYKTINFVAQGHLGLLKTHNKSNPSGLDSERIYGGIRYPSIYLLVYRRKYLLAFSPSNNLRNWNIVYLLLKINNAKGISGAWWFRILLILSLLSIAVAHYLSRVRHFKKQDLNLEKRVGERTEEFVNLNDKIQKQNDQLERQKNNIEKAYEELDRYKNKLEELVEERTRALVIEKDRVEAADQLKTSFLANLSHEIRTPMNAIIGFSGLMLDPEVTNAERESFKTIIDGSNNTLLNLINDILDFSKIESGHLDISLKEISLETVFEDLHQIFSFENKQLNLDTEKKLDFRLNIDGKNKEMLIYVDVARIKQVFSNLINNAIKFTQEGYIEVGYNLLADNILEFYVQDTGIGIDKKYHEIIFERFRKLEEEKKLFRGTGLGLTISFELVKLMGGLMRVESELGKGAKFSFTIQVINEKIKTPSAEIIKTSWELPNLFDKLILVAEDDFASYVYLEKLLRRTKASVIHASDGKEAIKLLKESPQIALVLMDIKMPVMNGIEALEEIKKLKIDIPVIAQTAYAFSGEADRIKTAGFTDYISKPINSRELYKTIIRHM